MGDLLIRDVSDGLKADLARQAKTRGRSLSEEAKLRLLQSLAEDDKRPEKHENAYDAIRSAFVDADALMTDEEHAEFMADVDRMRHTPPRPVPDLE